MKALSIVAAGAMTPLGLRAIDTAFACRAGTVAMREAPLLDGAGDPITMCFIPTLDPLATGVARALSIAVRAPPTRPPISAPRPAE